MQTRRSTFYFGLGFDFNKNNVFLQEYETITTFPPISGDFLLLDGSNFKLLDGTDFLLL